MSYGVFLMTKQNSCFRLIRSVKLVSQKGGRRGCISEPDFATMSRRSQFHSKMMD